MELSTFSNLPYSQFEGQCHDCLVFLFNIDVSEKYT